MPKNLYLRNGIYWARFKVGGVEYRESLRTRSERKAEVRLKARREEIEDQAVYGVAGPVSWLDAVVSWNQNATDSLGDKTFLRYTVSLRQLRGLGNRCSVLLSYRGIGGFPRFLRVSGQPPTRERRGTLRFVSAQESAQYVRESFLPSPATDGGRHG